MPRPRTGGAVFKPSATGKSYKKNREGKSIRGQWYARVKYTDPATGKQKSVWRAAANKNDAIDKCRALISELEQRATNNPSPPPSLNKTFAEVADYFSKRYIKNAEYVGDRKVAGLRSLLTAQGFMKTLRAYFGNARIGAITHGAIEEFKSHRLASPIILNKNGQTRTRQRALASVHRELALLRRVLRVAEREGWIAHSPFGAGDSLISLADETKRERILSLEEEDQLLAACTGARAHLKPILICALDTGMRRGEIFKLTWQEIDIENRTITIDAFNTKTMRSRVVPMSERLAAELINLHHGEAQAAELIFGIRTNVKRSFAAVCAQAGIEGLRFHDLRHSAATRLVRGTNGLSLPELARVLGHTQISTTYRYINPTTETIAHAKSIFDRLRSPNS